MAGTGIEPRIGVIGGSGLQRLLPEGQGEELDVATPFGPTSGPITVGELGGTGVAFLARHGRGHSVAPHEIPAKANVWALASLGVRAIVSSTAVGGLREELAPGSLVVPDQLIDMTRARGGDERRDTYFGAGVVEHLTFADPCTPSLVAAARAALARIGEVAVSPATTVVIDGPRFSTRAESRWYRSLGGDIVNMTQYPESALAAELGLGYVNLSFVTDTDAGVASAVDDEDAVDASRVFERLAAAQPRIVAAIAAIVAAVPDDLRLSSGIAREHVDAVLAMAPRVSA
ncbi:MTAP family purine nucleoside phosphorylase [Agrococcus jejuensis]|uniref:S-methyl-5'-thioadenosine phosphorylase n=1 Tax=Agrococcus jejuensis TaxID=399736 RepID=A0A1G8BBD5_9MICO|nr:MTAP family purine nucleoside phosphorylase [Agrococcus jejuensis]SDH30525.1 5'-methylthioadenosine phosphorylase [Agrococcus jejuensis]